MLLRACCRKDKGIMTNIINLNKKRKIKNRIEKEKKASENRVQFGRTKNAGLNKKINVRYAR